MKNIIHFCRVELLSPPLNFIKSLFGGHKCTTLLIIPLMVIVGCTPNPTVKKREVSKPKVDYVNNNPRSDALVIGVGEYKNRIRPLHGVEKDLKNIKKLLRHLNINNITTLSDSEATLSGVREAFDGYIRSDKNRFGNTFLFYYSGHGVQVVDKSGDEDDKKDEATALYDIDLDDKDFITDGILLDDELYSMLGKIKSKKILIFDKCHSGSSHRGYNPYIKAVEGEYKVLPKFLERIKNRSEVKNDLKDFVIFSATKD
ncbi:caspase family protein, partial [Sulfurovum sp. bin170]|uniref:caspase family protein n=1 Tax=Sulfurovum sp. bin170 TaxID=2695268 RepID=UPI0013E050A1